MLCWKHISPDCTAQACTKHFFFFFFVRLTLPSVRRLARLSSTCLFVEGKKTTCISASQLNFAEMPPSRTGQMWCLDTQKTTSSLRINLSIKAAELVLPQKSVFVSCKRASSKGVWRWGKNVGKRAFLLDMQVSSSVCGPSRLDVLSADAMAHSRPG